LKQNDNNASPEWIANFPQMVKQLEVSLYRSASSFQVYSDTTTLKTRLRQLAMEIAKKTQHAKEGSPDTVQSSRRSSSSKKNDGGSGGVGIGGANFNVTGGSTSGEAISSQHEVRQSSSSLSASGHSSLKQNEMGGLQKNMFSPGQQNNMPIPPQQQQSRRSINGSSSSNLKIRATTDIEAEAASARKKLCAAKGTDTSSNDNEKNGRDDTDAKSRHKRQRLLLLRHAAKCPHNDQCPVTPHCAEMKVLWKHIAYCKDSVCKVPHCMSSRFVLSHYRRCKPPCNICDPVKDIIKNGEADQAIMGETPTNRKKKMKEFWFLNV